MDAQQQQRAGPQPPRAPPPTGGGGGGDFTAIFTVLLMFLAIAAMVTILLVCEFDAMESRSPLSNLWIVAETNSVACSLIAIAFVNLSVVDFFLRDYKISSIVICGYFYIYGDCLCSEKYICLFLLSK